MHRPDAVPFGLARDRLAAPTQRGLRLSPRAAALLLLAFDDITRDGLGISVQDLQLYADGTPPPDVRSVIAWLVHTDIGRACFSRMSSSNGTLTRDTLAQTVFNGS